MRSLLAAALFFSMAVIVYGGALDALVDIGIKIDKMAEQQSKRYVRVINTMGKDVVVTANCASGDDTIKEQKLNDGQDFAWMFKPHFLGKTLFWCDVKTSNGKSKHWDVYKGKERSQNWYLKGDGIYQGDTAGNGLLKKKDWE